MTSQPATSSHVPPAEHLYEPNVGQTAPFLRSINVGADTSAIQPHTGSQPLSPVDEADSLTISSSAHASYTTPSQRAQSATGTDNPPAPPQRFPNPKSDLNPLPPDPDHTRRGATIHAPAADPLDIFAPSEEFATATAAEDINALLPADLTAWNGPSCPAIAPRPPRPTPTASPSIFSSSQFGLEAPAPSGGQPSTGAPPLPSAVTALGPPLEATTEALRVAGAGEASAKVLSPIQEPLTASLRSRNRSSDRGHSRAASPPAFVPPDAPTVAPEPAAAPPEPILTPVSPADPVEPPAAAKLPPVAPETVPAPMAAPDVPEVPDAHTAIDAAAVHKQAAWPRAAPISQGGPRGYSFSTAGQPLHSVDAAQTPVSGPAPAAAQAAVAPPPRSQSEILKMFPPRIDSPTPAAEPSTAAAANRAQRQQPGSAQASGWPAPTLAAPAASPQVPWYAGGGRGGSAAGAGIPVAPAAVFAESATPRAAAVACPAAPGSSGAASTRGTASPEASISLRTDLGGVPTLVRNGTAGSGTKASLQFDTLPLLKEGSATAELLSSNSGGVRSFPLQLPRAGAVRCTS